MYTLLRKVREARGGISQSELARKVGVSPSYLSKMENGLPAPREIAEKIAKFFENEITEIQLIFPERYADGQGGKRVEARKQTV